MILHRQFSMSIFRLVYSSRSSCQSPNVKSQVKQGIKGSEKRLEYGNLLCSSNLTSEKPLKVSQAIELYNLSSSSSQEKSVPIIETKCI